MKKKILFTLLFTLAAVLIIMLATCITASAFNLKIDGHYLSSTDDVNDIFGDGVYSFNRDTKTLTINKSPQDPKSIIVDDDDLTLYIPNDVTLGDIYFKGSATITGKGTLTASYIDPYSFLEIKNTRVIAKYIGYDDRTLYGDLYINNSYVNAKMGKFNSIDKVSCEMVSPSDYVIKYTTGMVGTEHKQYCAILNQHGVQSAVNVVFAPWGKYDLIIVGTTVTDENKDDILGDGKFSYDIGSKTLTVSDSYNSKYNGAIIDSAVEGLTINVIAERAELDSYTASQIRLYGNTEITGGGALFFKQSDLPGIEVLDGADLLLTDIKVFAVDAARFYSIKGSGGALEITNSNLYLRGDTAAVEGFDNISMYDCSITYPEGTYKTGTGFYDADGSTAKYVVIKKAETYDLYIMGERVTSSNCDSIRGGKNSYDPEKNILYIRDDMPNSPTNTYIESSVDGLTIQIEGDRTLTSNHKDYPAVLLNADTTITGGSLTLKNTANGMAMKVTNNAVITLDNTSLNATGGFGIASYPFGAALNIDSSDVRVTASGLSNSAAILGFTGGITLNGCEITTPQNASINKTNGGIYDGDTAAKTVVIGAGSYELYIDDVQVTKENMSNISGNGVFSYDPKTKTLTVSGNYSASSADCLISSYIDGLTINVTAASTLEAPSSCIYVNGDTTLKSSGKLTLKADEEGITCDDCSFGIENADLYIEAGYGIHGFNGKLYLKNSDIEIKANDEAIYSLPNYPAYIYLENESIVSPQDAELSDSNTKIVDDNGNSVKNLKLSAGTSGGGGAGGGEGQSELNADSVTLTTQAFGIAGAKVATVKLAKSAIDPASQTVKVGDVMFCYSPERSTDSTAVFTAILRTNNANAAAVASAAAIVNTPAAELYYGKVSNPQFNGKILAADVARALSMLKAGKYLSDYTDSQYLAADVIGGGSVMAAHVARILAALKSSGSTDKSGFNILTK